jgi:uncharacterized protein YraI
MRYRVGLILGIGLLLVGGAALVTAQAEVNVTDSCEQVLESLWEAASDACVNAPIGYVCNGGSAPQSAEPVGSLSSALYSLGALVEISLVDALQTAPIMPASAAGGIVWVRPDQPIRFTGLALGEVRLRDVTPPDFPAWQSIVVETLPQTEASCATTPPNVYIAQTPFGEPTNIVINGVSISLDGTILVITRPGETLFVGLSGQAGLFAVGQNQLVRTGQQISVPYNPDNFATPTGTPGIATPLAEGLIFSLPTALLDSPVIIPQPGYVTTQGDVNMRAAPNTDAALLLQVPAGEIISVLGRNPAGDWYHVRRASGETGWMYAPLLLQFVGTIDAIYEATPLPPQRYGEMGTTAKVLAPAGVNLRAAPDVTFPVLAALQDGTQVKLLARSPYSPWVKVDAGGLIGWLALITIQTEAVLEALPIDYDVPPPPEPTLVPGSFGNAFPDPNRSGN